MADIQVSVGAGTQTRLLTAGKYCADDILVAAGQGVQNNNFTDVLNGTTTDFYDNAATNLVTNAFIRNAIITSFTFLNVVSAGNSVLQLGVERTIFMPKIVQVPQFFAYNAPRLKWVYFGAAKELDFFSFSLCNALSALVLAGDQVARLNDTNALSPSGISDGTGFIYVPDDLVTQYQVATNWSTYAAQIKGLSELPAEVQEWLDQQGGASA